MNATTYPRGLRLGIINAGQLARMQAKAAVDLNIKTTIWGQREDDPAMMLADTKIVGDWSDNIAFASFKRDLCGILLDWENTPVWLIEKLGAAGVPVYKQAEVLRVSQDRLFEKEVDTRSGNPVTRFAQFSRPEPGRESEFSSWADPLPEGEWIIKTRRDGYDGKGQRRCASVAEVMAATSYAALVDKFGSKVTEFILEQVVDFEFECSVQVARNVSGDMVFSPAVQNRHENGILRESMWYQGLIPRPVEIKAQEQAVRYAEHLGVVGLLCSEFFVTPDGCVLKNEGAPRPHNSFHGSIEAGTVSQFTQYIQAVTPGLHLQTMGFRQPWVMVNLLGDEIFLIPILQQLGFACHDYGKVDVKSGRKMGHATFVGERDEMLKVRKRALKLIRGK